MRAWKLFRQLKSGELTSLFINKKVVLLPGIWIEAQCFPTKGYAVRPFWHCCETPDAPHLSTKNRIWMEVEMEDFTEFIRPTSQGGKWYLAQRIKIIKNE